MTLLALMQLSLARAGLSTTSSTFQDRARQYFNLGMKEIAAIKEWRWLMREASITTTAAGKTYNLAADVMRPISFRNVTDNFEMQIVDILKINRVDPDDDLSSGPGKVAVVGWDTTNSTWSVRLWPTPDANSETVTYQYIAYVDDLTSSNDGTELDTLRIPNWVQSAMVYYVAAHYMGEKGDIEGQQMDMGIFNQQVSYYAKADASIDGAQGNVTHLIRNDAMGFGKLQFRVNDGSLG